MKIRHVHASGKWSAPMPAFRRWVTACQRQASVVTLTELTQDRKVRYLRDLTGWGAATWLRNDRGECGTIWRERLWAHVSLSSTAVTRRSIRTATGHQRPPVPAAVARLREHGGRQRVTFVTVHLPSHVEFRGRLRRTRRAVVYVSALRGLRRLIRAERRTGVPVVLSGDFNLDHRRAWVRAYLKAALGGRLTWTRPPGGWRHHPGTHGRRLIDATRLYGPIRCSHTRVMAKRRGSDHRPFVEVLHTTGGDD